MDALFLNAVICPDSSIPMEIVGLKEVRLVFRRVFRKDFSALAVFSSQLTLYNLRIYDYRKCQSIIPSIGACEQATLSMLNVFVYNPYGAALTVGCSSAFLSKTTIIGCDHSVILMSAQVHMEDSIVSDMVGECIAVTAGTRITAKRSRFNNPQKIQLLFSIKSSGTFDHCRFECRPKTGSNSPLNSPIAAYVNYESNVRFQRCLFHGLSSVVSVIGSNSDAALNACVISKTYFVGDATENASLEVANCKVDIKDFLLRIAANVKGKVSFTNNKISVSSPSLITIDKVSKKPICDLNVVRYTPAQTETRYFGGGDINDKEKSEFTKSLINRVKQRGTDFEYMSALGTSMYKRCLKCCRKENWMAILAWTHGQDAVATEKFRHCGLCRKATYCSEECKRAHWSDHRLWCEGKRSLKS